MRYGFDFSPIYDAVSDDRAFAELARTVATTNGANAAILHWRFDHETADHEASYHDEPIDAAAGCGGVTDAMRTERQIGSRDEDPFVDWMRTFGQHSLYCVSGVFSHHNLTLAVGLHRGNEQSPFEAFALEQLHKMARPIMDVIGFRAKLKAARWERQLAEAALDGLGTGVMMLTPGGNLRFANGAAQRLIGRGDGLILRGDRLYPAKPEDASTFFRSLAQIGAAGALRTSSIAIGRETGGPYLLSLSLTDAGNRRYIMAVAQDPEHADDSLVPRLRDLFGLGLAEAEIARALSEGHDIETIAASRSTSVGTVRNQVKAIAAKMNCGRQSEVVSIIRSIPSLNVTGAIPAKKIPTHSNKKMAASTHKPRITRFNGDQGMPA